MTDEGNPPSTADSSSAPAPASASTPATADERHTPKNHEDIPDYPKIHPYGRNKHADENPNEISEVREEQFERFEPPVTSTPTGSKTKIAPPPKKNIRFLDDSISKIHVFPSLPATSSHGDKQSNYVTSLPIIPDQAQPYAPILYTFRIPDKWSRMYMHLRIRTPPFYLQLDHAIAVVWCMFAPSAKKQLGIAQLQWALCFLKSIHNRNGELPKDVQLCIDGIQDYLLELYADVSYNLDALKNMDKSQRIEEEAPIETEVPFSINYSDIAPKYDNLKPSSLQGGQLVNVDDVFRNEVDLLKNIVGTESVELITSKSREAAIDYLHETRKRHLRSLIKEVERVRSLENLINVIDPDLSVDRADAEDLILSYLRANDSSDIENSDQIGAYPKKPDNN